MKSEADKDRATLNKIAKDAKTILKTVEEHHAMLCDIKRKVDHMAKTQAELVADVKAIGDKLTKIGAETATLLTKVTDLQAALANAGNVTPELQAAVDAVAEQAKVVDDLVPDPTP